MKHFKALFDWMPNNKFDFLFKHQNWQFDNKPHFIGYSSDLSSFDHLFILKNWKEFYCLCPKVFGVICHLVNNSFHPHSRWCCCCCCWCCCCWCCCCWCCCWWCYCCWCCCWWCCCCYVIVVVDVHWKEMNKIWRKLLCELQQQQLQMSALFLFSIYLNRFSSHVIHFECSVPF